MTTKKTETKKQFFAKHLKCLDGIKKLAAEADKGQPQPFCTMEIGVVQDALIRVLTASWNK